MSRSVGRPKIEEKQRVGVQVSRLEVIKMLVGFSDDTFEKIRKAIVEVLK